MLRVGEEGLASSRPELVRSLGGGGGAGMASESQAYSIYASSALKKSLEVVGASN